MNIRFIISAALAAVCLVACNKPQTPVDTAPEIEKQAEATQPVQPVTPPPAVTPAVTETSVVAKSETGVVARVNGTEISRLELDNAVHGLIAQMASRGRNVPAAQMPQLERDVLDEIIGRELVLQDAKGNEPADIDTQVQKQVDQITTQLGGSAALTNALADAGITPAQYAQRVRNNLIVQEAMRQFIEREVKMTPEEVKAFYDEHPEQFLEPTTVRASHILIRVPPGATDETKKEKRAQIDAARALLTGGEKFADVAKKVSEDPGSAANGGDLGFFPRGAMVPEFDAAAFSMKTNELSDVITTQFGYHILTVTDQKPARTVPFDEVKVDLENFLKNRKGSDAARQHVNELRKTAKVEILLPPVAESPPPPPPVVVETPPVQAPQP